MVTIVDPRLPIGIDRLRSMRLPVGEEIVGPAPSSAHGERIAVDRPARRPSVVR